MTDTPEENETLVGFTMLKDASKNELIDEILEYNRRALEGTEDKNQLIAIVISNRVSDYRNRLAEEAGMVATPLGFGIKSEDDDDE